MQKNLDNPRIRFSFKVSFFYFLLALLMVIYSDFNLFGISSGSSQSHLSIIVESLVLLIITTVIFFVLVFMMEKKRENAEMDADAFADVFDNSPFMVTVTDADGKIRYVNSNFIRVTGYKKNDVEGKRFSSLSSMPADIFIGIIEDLRSGKLRMKELVFNKSNGASYTELASGITITNTESGAAEFVKISLDITDIKENESNLIKEKNKIEILNNAKTLFLENMSQEIRTPMSGIIGMTELMQLTTMTKEQKDYLDIINFSSGTLLAIINDLLDFSRIETGKLKLEKVEFNIRDLVSKTCQILDFDAKKKNIALKHTIDSNIRYNIAGDPLRINQIIINLLRNAIKFTDKGEVELSLREVSRKSDSVTLRFEVRDTGSGISKNVMDFITEKNDVSDYHPHFEYKGNGLGLTIVKHLLHLLKGEIKVETTDKGTVFIIDIPFDVSGSYVEAEEIRPAFMVDEVQGVIEKPVDEDQFPGAVNILVAEDNIVNQRLVKELLIRKSYNVKIVENGLKLFDAMEDKKYDIILMDIQMPVMDGLEATSIIREIEKGTGKHIPIIGITAYAVTADREKCISAGMDDYLTKPFVKEEFYSVIEKHIESH